MAVVLHLYLEAHNPARNHHRAYDIALVHDLLGDWVVVVHKGRCGQAALRSRALVVDSLEAGQRVVLRLLRRRLTAPRRIGCAYEVRHVTASPAVTLNEWLPQEWQQDSGLRGKATRE